MPLKLSRLHRRSHYRWDQFHFECDDTLRWEIHRWCIKSLKGEWSFKRDTYDCFFIKHPRDAMMFKLAWVDAIHIRRKA